MRSLFYWVIIGFASGVFLHSVFDFELAVVFFLSLIFIALFSYAVTQKIIFKNSELKQYSAFFLILVFCISCCLGLWRYHWFASFHGDECLRTLIGKSVELEGIIIDEPARKEKYTQLVVNVTALPQGATRFVATSGSRVKHLSSTKILIRDDAYSRYTYGDKIKMSGILDVPKNFETENGRTFDYVSYLAKEKIFFIIVYPKIELLSSHQGNRIFELLFALKKRFLHVLDQALPYVESKLGAGLVVAGKESLPKNVQDEFVRTGTVQIVVLSGYNVTIIAETIMALLSSLPRILGATLGGVSIILFAIVAGGSATIVRAAGMALIALLGKVLRRNYHAGRALIVAAFLMLLFNPMLLVFDPSFQLSFIATFGLIFVSPLFQKKFSWITERWKLREIISSTIVTQLFLTPFLLYLTGTLSLVAVPANVLVSLIVPITMLMSFTTGMLGMIMPLLAWFTKIFAFILLRGILFTVHLFSLIPFASITFTSFPFWCVASVYVGYAVVLWRFSNKKPSIAYKDNPQREGART